MRLNAFLSAAFLAAAAALPAQAGLTPAAHQAILVALDDEYHAAVTYSEIIRRYGLTRPFDNIRRAELGHAEALIALLRADGQPVPANPYADGTRPLRGFPASAAEACAAGIAAEIENIRLYDDELLPAVAGQPETQRVLAALRSASAERHLPAFRRCADGKADRQGPGMRGGQGGAGRGAGMGTGQGSGHRGG